MKLFKCDLCMKEVKTGYELHRLKNLLQFKGMKDLCNKCNQKANEVLVKAEKEAALDTIEKMRLFFKENKK